MKVFAYFACGVLMPFAVGVFIAFLPIAFAVVGIKGFPLTSPAGPDVTPDL